MAVIVKYVVVRNGKEEMTFANKKDADAHDKMLDIAEGLLGFLQTSEIDIADDKLDDLTFFMAKHRDQIGKLLKGSKTAAAEADEPAKDTEKVPELRAVKGKSAKPKTAAA